jgi:type IV pilus assembly protein PilM
MSDSVWKKEISFKRKPKSVDPAEELVEPEVAADEPKQSVWKKEISLSRKPKEPKAPKEPKERGESFLKKEISFSRKRDKEIERLAEAAAQAFAVEEPVPAAQAPVEIAEAVVAAMPPVDEPEPLPVPAPALPEHLAPPPPPPPAPVYEYQGLSPEILAASAEIADVPESTPDVAWPEPEPVAAPLETWTPEPELPPAAQVAEPVVVHPPVPAAELPPLPEAPAAPFWKKELSLSRKPKEPKAPKAPKAAGAPFWKKELSLGKKKPAVDEVIEQLPAVKEKSAPFWKRDVSFGRKKNLEFDEVTGELPAPKEKGAPFWKRDLSLGAPKLSLPSRGGGHSAKKVVGLKIGASQLAAARVSNNGVAELHQLAREPLPAGVVVAGELRDPDALGDALKAFFARHRLPRKGVRLGIASNRIGVRIFDIVGVDEDKQLANAVQFRAQEALPIPLDEAVLDYRVLGESVDETGQPVKRVLLVVAYRELVERYVNACRKAGISLAGIDLEAFALLRALGAPGDRGASALVGVTIGHDRSTFAVSDGRVCEFTRVVEWGGSSLNVALARVFDSTPSEVEGLKRTLSLDGTVQPDDLSPEQLATALDAVRRQVQTFARELVSSLQFYQNQPGSLGIGEVVLTGGTAHLPGLAAELERLIGVRVRVGDPLARLKVSKRLGAPEQVGSLAVAIGLGIED